MKNRLFRTCITGSCLLVVSLSTAPVLAGWYSNQSEIYYKPQEFHNDRFGDFPPADIEQKIFSHVVPDDKPVEKETSNEAPSVPATSNQQVLEQPQISSQQNYSQQYNQQPAYTNYNRSRNITSPANQRYNRNTNLRGPRNNNRTSFSGPWNNSGSGFSGPWDNSGSGFSGPWNNSGSGFSGPWNNNNNGSNFSMPWGNNNGSNFMPWGNGGR